MADNERKIVTTFEANIDQFNAATQKLNSDIKGINAQFQNATASLGKWSDNQDGLKAKIIQLNKTLKVQQNALLDSKKRFNDLVAAGKENSKEAQQLAAKILKQETAIKKTEKAVSDYNKELLELQDAGVQTRKELDKLNKEAEESKKAFDEASETVKNGFLVGVAGIGAACFGALRGLSSLVENTAELRLEQGRVQTAFEQAGHSADTAKKIYNDFNAVLGDTARTTEAMQHMAQLADDQEELNTLVQAGTGIFATYGNSLPIESLMEAANETARSGELTGALTDSIVWAGKSEEGFQKQLDKCNTEQERQSLIIKTLNELYGEAGKAYQETNKDVIEATRAQDEYNNKMAEIAAKVQPALTDLKLAFVDALTQIMNKFSEADIENLINGISNIITSLVTNVMPPLMSALSWVLDNMNWLAPAIMGVTAGILAATAAYKAITLVMNIVKIAQLGLNAAMAANPIGLIVTAIGVLVGAFTILWNKCDWFRKGWNDFWTGVKKTCSIAKDFIVGIFEGIINVMKAPINAVIALINGAIRGINKISVDIPEWVPKWGGKKIGFNIPEIPQLAKGAIVDKATLAMVGENGKEAIMPLENNTQWIDKLAEKLAGKIGTNVVNNFNYTFEKMETTQYALHRAQLETKRIVGGQV